jgi:hypothetical protein
MRSLSIRAATTNSRHGTDVTDFPRSFLLLLVCTIACNSSAGDTRGPAATAYRDPEVVGTVDTPGLVELSGLAASRARDDTLWAHNDSLNEPILYALGNDGRDLGSIRVEGVSYLDWEDLASFELNGRPYLVVGDVGDNKALRPFVSLWFLEEPTISDGRVKAGVRAAPAWQIHYRYEDGPRDCESLAVDEIGERILLLSKRTDPPVLYELPLVGTKGGSRMYTARRLAALPGLEKPAGLDVSPDGTRAVVQTRRATYVFDRDKGQDWEEVFLTTPQRIEMPRIRSIEAVTFDRKGRSIFVTGEQRPNPLVRIDPVED